MFKKKLISFLVICFLFFLDTSSLFSQISGIVLDEQGSVLIGVNIRVQDSNSGTVSRNDGTFTLDWRSFPVKIIFSAIGKKTIITEISKPQNDLRIILKSDLLGLSEISVTSSRFSSALNRVNSTPVTRLTVEDFANKGNSDATSLLKAEPGVFVQQSTPGQGSIYVRGVAGRDVLYLFNGLRMNPSFVRSGQNQYFGSIDPFAIQQLDVYRGPFSVLYGSDALSGGVDTRTTVKDFTATETVSASATTQFNFGGNGEQTINGQVGYQNSKVTFFVNGTARDFNYYHMPGGANSTENFTVTGSSDRFGTLFPFDRTLSNADHQFYALNASAKLKLNSKSSLTAVSYYSTLPDAPRFDRMIIGFGGENGVENPRAFFESNTAPMVFSAHHITYSRETDVSWLNSFKATAGFFKLRDDRKIIGFSGTPNPGLNPPFSASDELEREFNNSNQFQVTLDLESPLKENLALKWGVDVSLDHVNSKKELRSPAGNTELLPRFPNGSEYWQIGLFTQLEHKAGSHFNLNYGLRYSYIYADIDFEGLNSQRGFDPFTGDFNQLTGSFGASYGVSSITSLHTNVSTGFRAPNLSDLSELGRRRTDELQTANTNLNPETTLNVDLGIRISDGFFQSELFGFFTHYFDRIQRVETGNIVDREGRVLRADDSVNNNDEFIEVQSQNEDSIDMWGIEYAGSYHSAGQWEAGLTFTYIWGKLNRASGGSEPVDRIPPANGMVYVEYSPKPNLSVRPQVRYAFEQNRISPDEIGDNRVSRFGTNGYANFQFILNWKPVQQLNLRVMADNLTNTNYREHASTLDGMRRNISVSITYSLP